MTAQDRVMEHYKEALNDFPRSRILAICLQGSQNYGLDTPQSDVDTKLIVIPSLDEIALNKQPVSTTKVLNNGEHLDVKDVRVVVQTFKKQNVNFLEILFTDYYYLNPTYEHLWNKLVKNREAIAHLNPYRAMKAMMGMVYEKYHALEHPYPSKIDLIEKYGYDGKQLSHIIRLTGFMSAYYYLHYKYKDCLVPINTARETILKAKANEFSLEEARYMAEIHKTICESMCEGIEKQENNPKTENLLDSIQIEIIKTAIKEELNNGDN